MKKIEIITRPFRLDELKDILSTIGIDDIIVTDIRCSNKQDNGSTYLHEDYFVEFLPKIKAEFFVDEKLIKKIKEAVVTLAEGEEGDDTKIYAFDAEEV